MPNARVGALPQTYHRDDSVYQGPNERGRGGRQNGISMLDLKKQTARRLAEEQHQLRSGPKQQHQMHQVRSQRLGPHPQSHQPSTQIHLNLNQSHHGGHQKQIDKNFGNRNRPQNFPNQQQRFIKEIPLQANNYAQQQNNQIDTKFNALLRNNAQLQSYNDVFSETSSLKSDRESTGSTPSSSLQAVAGKMKNVSQVRNNTYNDVQNTHMIHNAKNIPMTIGKVSRNSVGRDGNDSRTVSELMVPQGGNHGHQMSQQLQPDVHGHVDINRQLHQHHQQYPTMLHGNMNYHPQHNMHYTNVSGAPRLPHQPQNGLKPIPTSRDTNQHHNQNKLPHGLTVQELKEMTKARLAAEAAIEKNSRVMKPVKINGQSTSTYQRKRGQADKRHQNRKSGHVTAGAWQEDSQIEPSYSWQRPESQNDQLTLKNIPHPIVSPRQHLDPQIFSPAKEAHFTYPGNLHHLPYGQKQEKGIDSLDSGSVTSFNSTIASEYLGSETASTSILGPSIHQSFSDDLLFPRSYSYPSGNNITHDENNNFSSGFDFPEKTNHVGSARRRLGSSPPGFHLEVAHEDRPFSVTEELQSANVVGSQIPQGTRTFDERSLRSVDSSISLSSKLQGVKSHYHNEDFNEIYNQGSSSCGSVSNSFFEKNKEAPRDYSTLTSMNGELPNLVAESVLGSSALQNDRRAVGRTNRKEGNVTNARGRGVNDVFRVQSYNQKLSTDPELMQSLTQKSANADILLLGRENCGSGSWGGSNSAMSGQSITEIWSQDFNNILPLDKRVNPDYDSTARRHVTNSKSSMSSETADPKIISRVVSHPLGLGANGGGSTLTGNALHEHSSLGVKHDWNSTFNGNRYNNPRKN